MQGREWERRVEGPPAMRSEEVEVAMSCHARFHICPRMTTSTSMLDRRRQQWPLRRQQLRRAVPQRLCAGDHGLITASAALSDPRVNLLFAGRLLCNAQGLLPRQQERHPGDWHQRLPRQ